jgi:hypothetical protein
MAGVLSAAESSPTSHRAVASGHFVNENVRSALDGPFRYHASYCTVKLVGPSFGGRHWGP